MVYLSSTIIALILFFAEVSLLPHFFPWITLPILLLPFFSILGLKDRTIYPIILAGIFGILTDSVSGGHLHVYLVAYLGIMVVTKLFLGRFLSYGEFRANLINLFVGIIIIYGADIAFRIGVIGRLYWILPLLLNICLAVIVLIAFVVLGQRYLGWLEKETEERFR